MKLPLDCTANYFNHFLNKEDADALYSDLMINYKINQAQLTINAGGKLIKTDSYKILFATQHQITQNNYPENIHGKCYTWQGTMLKLKHKVEAFLNKEFEIAMCLYYPNGNYFAPYHSDQETSGFQTILPSLSLGEVRTFSFKNKVNDKVYSLDLAHGSLLVMADYCQSRYMHSLPQDTNYKHGRINITFREPSFK